MKEIKTVWTKADQRNAFDEEVNYFIAIGFTLDKYEVFPSYHPEAEGMLFALLYKERTFDGVKEGKYDKQEI